MDRNPDAVSLQAEHIWINEDSPPPYYSADSNLLTRFLTVSSLSERFFAILPEKPVRSGLKVYSARTSI